MNDKNKNNSGIPTGSDETRLTAEYLARRDKDRRRGQLEVVVNHLAVARNPYVDQLLRDRAINELSRYRDEPEVAEFFAERAREQKAVELATAIKGLKHGGLVKRK